jgi:hypothetical protein
MEALKQQQRTVTISESEKADAIKLLKLMGIPVLMQATQSLWLRARLRPSVLCWPKKK